MVVVIRPVRWVDTITAAYAARVNGGQVRNVTTRDRMTRLVQAVQRVPAGVQQQGDRLAATSSGGATMISMRCCTMWSQNSTSS